MDLIKIKRLQIQYIIFVLFYFGEMAWVCKSHTRYNNFFMCGAQCFKKVRFRLLGGRELLGLHVF